MLYRKLNCNTYITKCSVKDGQLASRFLEVDIIESRDEFYMRRAIELAKKGEGWTNPNPMVGAVVVKDDRIIGEGCHEKYGQFHAERNALSKLTESAEGATIYVTLEPCCHYGKTPPCTEAIMENKIGRVVIGSRDPNPKVAGKGARILREAGIQVEEDFLREECDQLNKVFFHYITTKMPYVVMKYAMTLDGKIATKTGASQWITGEEARNHVHQLRHRYMGIMVGIETVLADNPMLNTRIEGKKSPIRIICDSSLRIPLDTKICKTAKEYRTIVAHAESNIEKINALESIGVETIYCPDSTGRVNLCKLMEILGEKGIDSILLEGGAALNYSALSQKIVNKAMVYVAPKIFGGEASKTAVSGQGVEVPSQAFLMNLESVTRVGGDLLLEYEMR